MLFISATKRDAYFKVAELRKKLLRFAQSRCAHHSGGICLKMEDLSLSIILLLRNFQM